MTVHFESSTTQTCIVSVSSDAYDYFKRKVLMLNIANWVLLLGPFAAALVYILTALTSDIWWYGVIALTLAIIVAFICSMGCSVLKESLASDLAIKHGWKGHYPFILKPNYQIFLHD